MLMPAPDAPPLLTSLSLTEHCLALPVPAQEHMLHNLPDTMSRVGESVGGGIQYIVHKTADTVHNATHPYDEGES